MGDRVRSGHLLPLHPGVYAAGHARLRREGHWLAAVLAIGPGAVLSHRDAAGLHDLRAANHALIDVLTAGKARSSAKIAVHRTRVLDAQDITTVRGIPVTTVARTLVDLASVLSADRLAGAIKEAERRNAFDLKAIEAAMVHAREAGPGPRGAQRGAGGAAGI